MTDPFEEEQVQFERCVKPTFGDGISYSDIATKLLKENFLLTALELHTELVEAGRELPKLKEFFSNPGNFEQASLRPETLPSIPRSSSQATLDSLDLTRYSEDGERGVDERVAVLEFELRKAKETISALRANLTVATESEATTPDTGSVKPLHNESIKPHEQRALNFLINEYLLVHGYKLTSITFADENEHQDFEDWDDVGLNIPKPAEVLTLYRDYMRHAQAPCSDMEIQTDDLPSDTQMQQLQLAVEQLEVLKLEKRELEQRLWSSESRMEEVSNLTTPGSDVGGVITENISTHSDTPERFELIDAEMKGGEDLDNSRVEDDGSAVVSLAGTDVGWTRVSQAGVGTGHSPPTPAGSSDENLSALLNTPISRSVPALFQKEVLARCFVTSRPQDGNFIDEILNDGISEERLVYILGQSLPRIIPNVILNKREELLPLIISTIHLHPEASERDKLLHLLFNLKKRPHEEERRMILTGIVGIARCSGLSLVENEILPQCWEQISHKHLERRLLVAESCSALAPYVSSSIRNSLMLSMLQQMLLEDKDEMVREVVVRSLALIVTFMDDKDKYYQCEELSMTALDDPSPSVVGSATRILLPVLAKWSLELDRLQASLITHLIQRLKSQTKPIPVESPGKQGLDSDQQMAWTLTVIQTLLPYLVMSVVAVEPVLSTITPDTTIVEPSEVFDLNNGLTNPGIFYEGEYPVSLILGAFDSYVDKEWQEAWPQMDWITSTLLPELLDVLNCTQVNRELVVATFIKMFRYISAGFGRAFIKHKVKPVFAERLQILEKSLADSRSSVWPSLTIIPVYLVGLLAARRDQEFTDELEGLLKRFVCALPVCGAPIHTLEVTIRCLCENTALHETVLVALWEGVVHPRAAVRSSAAILFVSMIGHVSEVLVASRIAPALVTLASDPDISVRTSTIPAFGSLITNTTMKEVQDKTYMQLQSFLSDPSTRDNHTMLVQLVVTMGHIVSSCETWFREEVILPQLAAMSAYTLQMSNQTRRLDLAVALIEAFSSAVYCSLSKQTISTILLPGLRYLEPISGQSLSAHHDTVMAMIKGAESRVEPQQPIERSGSVSLATATANVGQGMEDMKQKVTKYFQSKPNINRQTNLPHLPALFRKK